jgi:hypothetical protein
MILLFFITGIILVFTFYYFLSYLKWKENKREEDFAISKSHKVFEGLRVSSFSSSKHKSLLGVELKAKLYFIDDCLIITSHKMNMLLFETMLPLRIENNKGAITKIKMTAWKTLLITYHKDTFSLGKAKIDITIKAKDNEQQLAIYNEIKDWI